jgi:oxalate decarboxylase/phosphoglucose isomerase-like protein (cupin superfamily)
VHAGGPPLHVHEAEDEVVVVLEGQLTYQVGEDRGHLSEGGLLWFPRRVPHAIANHSGQPVRFLTVVTPAGIEDFFRSQRDYLGALAPGAEPDAAAMADLPGATERTVTGPPLRPQPTRPGPT